MWIGQALQERQFDSWFTQLIAAHRDMVKGIVYIINMLNNYAVQLMNIEKESETAFHVGNDRIEILRSKQSVCAPT
jgi:uncharacterized protein YukE